MIVKDNITDDEDTIIDDLKMAVKQHTGSFAVPHCFMVTASHCIRVYVADCFNKKIYLFCCFAKSTKFTVKCFYYHTLSIKYFQLKSFTIFGCFLINKYSFC